MVCSDISFPVPPIKAPRRRRRRWLVLLAGILLLAGGLAAAEGWTAWEERAARRALEEEHLDAAQQHIDRALWLRPRREATNVLAARIARLRRENAAAEDYLSRCGGPEEMSERVQLEWLLLRCERGELDSLAPSLLALVEHGHPESVVILETLASLYMRQTRYETALHCLDLWVEREPNSVRALHWRGWVHNQMDHRGQAIGDYERVLELQPDQSAVRLGLAEVLIDSSRAPEAVPHLERLRAEQPDNPGVLVALARCRIAQARRDDARELLDSVLAAHPDHVEALHYRGTAELEARHFVEAERWLRRTLELAPQDAEARYSLFLTLQAQGNRKEEARQELARWEEGRKTTDRLMRLLRTELSLRPGDANLAEETGELFLRLGIDDKGLFWLHRALTLDPRHVASHRALLAYYERTNKPAMAAEQRKQLAALGAEK